MLNKFLDKFIMVNQLKYKDYNFFITKVPFAIVPIDLLVALSAKQDEKFNKQVYYAMKVSTAKRLVPEFKLQFGFKEEKYLNFLETFFTACGFGMIHTVQVDFEKARAILTVSNSPIAQALQGRVSHPVDHFLRGVFAGIFSVMFQLDVECVESKCLAVHSGCCEFIIEKPDAMDFTKREVQEQLELKV